MRVSRAGEEDRTLHIFVGNEAPSPEGHPQNFFYIFTDMDKEFNKAMLGFSLLLCLVPVHFFWL